MKKILVFALPGIGNTLLLTPMLKALKKSYKDSKITVLVMYKACKEILEGNPNVDEIILFEFLKEGYLKSLKFANNLSKQEFDISILPHPSNELYYSIVSYFCKARLRIAHKYPNFNMKFDSKYPYIKMTSLAYLHSKTVMLENSHEIEENLNLLKVLDINVENADKSLYLKIKTENIENAARLVKNYKISGLKLGIHPGSSNLAGMQNKRWPQEKFIELCNYLIDNYRATILIFGGKEEEQLKSFIRNSCARKEKCILVDTNSIKDTAALIKECNYFITNDSGLMHIASALNIPVITISGAADYRRTHTLNRNSAVVYHNISCYPCYKYGEKLECKRKEKDYACLKCISIYNVVALIEKLKKNEDLGPILERI